MYIVLTQCFPSRLGGIESLVSNLALTIAKNNKVIVFADRHHLLNDAIYDKKHNDKILVRRFGGLKFFRRRKKIKELKPFIESQKVRCVIADTWKSLELCIGYLNEKNISTLCLAHGNELLSYSSKKKERMIKTLDKSNIIVGNSIFTSDLLKKLLPNKKNIKFVYPGAINLEKIKSDNFFEIKGNPVLITIARLEKRKGHELILNAIKKLVNDFPSIRYIIAGEGSEKQNLINIVKKQQLESNISFVGLVNDSQKKYLFENSDLMVMPTLDESKNRSIEGFGIAYLEAAFFSIPSIASNVGGTKEAVLHNKTGIIIENFDELYLSIYDLLINPDKRKLLGKEAQKRAKLEFDWDVVANKYLEVSKHD